MRPVRSRRKPWLWFAVLGLQLRKPKQTRVTGTADVAAALEVKLHEPKHGRDVARGASNIAVLDGQDGRNPWAWQMSRRLLLF